MTDTCKFCPDAPSIRPLTVRVGAPPGREVTLFVDEDPHPAGDIVQLESGEWRQLGPRDPRVLPTYRCHGRTICGPDAAAKRDRVMAASRTARRKARRRRAKEAGRG